MNDKTEITPAVCKSHNGRTERDFRICSSKLSKRELEDLYYTLLENNLDLKKTINNQQAKIKVLSTKLQRMTAVQKNSLAKEPKDCCAHTKAIVNEHKQSIAELKNENVRLTERIRVLNMRLCSAKQFTRRSSSVYASTCAKCSCVLTGKNSSMSVIHSKQSENNFKSATVSSQYLDKDFTSPTRSVVVATNENEQEKPEKPCDENKCRTIMEELKQKIEDLQVELSKTHENYSGRINSLEQEVSELHKENQRTRSECAASEYGLQQREQRAEELARRLRAAEAQYGELSAQLSIEKRKVAELETHVKAADISRSLAKTIDDHITNTSQVKIEILNQPMGAMSSQPYFSLRCDKSISRLEVPSRSRKSDASTDMADQKASDDSGYTDVNRSQDDEKDKAMSKLNEELMERINVLQEQLTVLKMSTNVRVDNNIITVPEEQNVQSVESEARTTRDLEESHTESYEKRDEEMIKAESKYIADSKKWQDINSDLQMNNRKRDSHNSYQIPGPMPVDVETRKAIRQKEKIAAFKFKQLIDANNKKKTHKRNKETQREIQIADDDSTLINEVYTKEIDNVGVDDNTLAQNKVPRKSGLDKISMKSTNEEKSTDLDVNVDARRKSVEEKFTILGERSINGMRSPRISASNVNDTDQVSPIAEDNLANNGPEFGTQSKIVPPKEESKGVVEPSPRRRSATYSKGDTYCVPWEHSGATSPDNTDLEISSLTDLPSEKDAKSPCTLSPGEEKATTTYTDSYTAPTTDYGSLSLGELPATGREQQSIGETKVKFANVPSLTSQRMEETLQAISEELARCRHLLTSQRSPEVKRLIINR